MFDLFLSRMRLIKQCGCYFVFIKELLRHISQFRYIRDIELVDHLSYLLTIFVYLSMLA